MKHVTATHCGTRRSKDSAHGIMCRCLPVLPLQRLYIYSGGEPSPSYSSSSLYDFVPSQARQSPRQRTASPSLLPHVLLTSLCSNLCSLRVCMYTRGSLMGSLSITHLRDVAAKTPSHGSHHAILFTVRSTQRCGCRRRGGIQHPTTNVSTKQAASGTSAKPPSSANPL